MLTRREYKKIRLQYFGETGDARQASWLRYKKHMENKMNCFDRDCSTACQSISISDIFYGKSKGGLPVSTLQNAKCPCDGYLSGCDTCPKVKQEGKTPMRYNENNAIATITSAKSDTAITRDYLLSRLDSAVYPKMEALVSLFNLHVDNTPRNFSDLIAVIKAGTYTIDPKVQKKFDALDAPTDWYHGATYGIIWPGPKKDIDGYHAAETEMYKQSNTARDIIMTGDGAAALAALQAFEAWLPTPAAMAS